MRFTDVTGSSGIQATMTSGSLPSTQILEVKGGGLALIDFDGDGDLDLFLPNGATLADPERGPGAKLFRNDSKPDALTFVDVTAASGIDHHRWSFGVTVGDIDADGHLDIFIACYGPDVLLRNKGDGTFEDITTKAGVAGSVQSSAPKLDWSTGCAFGDVDADGDLDLFVVTYLEIDPSNLPGTTLFRGLEVMSGPIGMRGQADRLFRNRGDGTFEDISEASGITKVKPSYGLGVAMLDFTGDGKTDIFVGNDSQASHFFRNVGESGSASDAPPTFVEEGVRNGLATNMEGLEQATMGIAIGDVDGNGWPDIFTTNFSSDTNTLRVNKDGKFFDERTSQYGLAAVSRPYLGWATAFADFEHDGDEDLLIVNGHVYPQATKKSFDSEYEQRTLLHERRGKRFETLSEAGNWKLEPHRDRTAVFADLDRDGDVDMVIGELNGPMRVIRNDHAKADVKDWLVVTPIDRRPKIGNRLGVGSVLTVRSKDPDGTERVQRRWLWGGGPFNSTIAPELHVGVPAGSTAVHIEFVWPDGLKVEQDGVELGQRIAIERK
ncbi:MAG: CRTAC1 family protein [Phycisphaerae bacterium]|nr:CRTAC1 family protein [Phycisphaerae bacterium]